MRKGIFIETFGCQMNVRDSRQIVALMNAAGYEEVDNPRQADVIFINTCTIREKAVQKVISRLGRLRRLKAQRPEVTTVVGGCLAQQEGKALLERVHHLDLVVGTHNIRKLPELIAQVKDTKGRAADTSFSSGLFCYPRAPLPKTNPVSTFVTIMQGCNNFCTYCVVPYVRGPEESRPAEEITAEITELVKRGVKEVTLLGQNVNSYGNTVPQDMSFPRLLEAISQISGLERIRFTTSHPKDISAELIACFASMPKLCPHIHLPFQSGSNDVLQRMNRGYFREEYIEKVRMLRECRPDIAITADVIVGFPGETDDDFAQTLDLMGKITFDNLFSFKYSPREGTAAYELDGKVPDEVKAKRLVKLQQLQTLHTWEKHQAMIGRRVAVLVEGISRNTVADVTGRTPDNRIVNFPAPHAIIGKTVTVTITDAFLHSLRGNMTNERGKTF